MATGSHYNSPYRQQRMSFVFACESRCFAKGHPLEIESFQSRDKIYCSAHKAFLCSYRHHESVQFVEIISILDRPGVSVWISVYIVERVKHLGVVLQHVEIFRKLKKHSISLPSIVLTNHADHIPCAPNISKRGSRTHCQDIVLFSAEVADGVVSDGVAAALLEIPREVLPAQRRQRDHPFDLTAHIHCGATGWGVEGGPTRVRMTPFILCMSTVPSESFRHLSESIRRHSVP